ncbi:MAG TPA: molybdopterin converting factor subunit 1 [Candidatus Binatia bacterium]|nr:molybdopterin converting factor subunit 1 [Candidatus Binatia bacterium]
MRVRLRYFASLREALGTADERAVRDGTTAGALWSTLVREHPAVARVRVRFAVDERYVDADHVLADGDELAVFPPVSGGC